MDSSANNMQPVVVLQSTNWAKFDKYDHRQSKIVGIVLFVTGILSVLFNIVDLVIGLEIPAQRTWSRDIFSLSDISTGAVGHGFWCGIMNIISGGLGIAAGEHKLKCLITGFLVMDIIACVFSGAQLVIASIGSAELRRVFDLAGFCGGHSYCNEIKAVYSMELMMALLGAVGIISNCWGYFLTCTTTGRCGNVLCDKFCNKCCGKCCNGRCVGCCNRCCDGYCDGCCDVCCCCMHSQAESTMMVTISSTETVVVPSSSN